MGELEETQGVKTSEENKETSKETETLTREQAEEEKRKVRSDALAEVGRLKASSESAIKSARAAQERIDRMLKEQDESELETAKEQPDKLTVIRERQARRGAEAKLAKAEQELEGEKAKTAEAQEAVVKSTKERNAREIATRLNVDAKTLIKFTDGSAEAMEELAKSLPQKGETKTLTPDSGKTIGGGKTYKSEEILKTLDPSTMTPQQISEQVKELAKAAEEGRIKK